MRWRPPGSAGGSPASAAPELRSRGYLPHLDAGEIVQMITYRLADSLPASVRLQHDAGSAERRRVDAMLDRGLGRCMLRRPEIAAMIVANWRHFDGTRYRLHAWVVMPNHVHVVATIHPDQLLSRIAHAWKSYSAHRIRRLAGVSGPIWQPEYWDRFIRNERHFASAVAYVEGNPVAAGLAQWPGDWPYSSAAR